MALGSAQKCRALSAVVIRAHQVATDSKFVTMSKESMNQFQKMQKEAKESGLSPEKIRQKLGPAPMHCANGM
eukprot:4416548-Karenia_brevis.AAC.1